MSNTRKYLAKAPVLGVAIVAVMTLGGCATYSDEFATINSRLDTLDARVQDAAQSAQQANQRLDRIENRVQNLESAPGRVPRG